MAASHPLSVVYHFSAVVAPVFCTPMLVYLPPHFCFCVLVAVYICRPPAVHLQKFVLIVDPLRMVGGYISRYTVFNLTLVIKHYLEQKILFIVGLYVGLE